MRKSSPDSAREILVLVGRILSALRNSKLYPEGHPIFEKLLDDAYLGIDKHLQDKKQLEFRIGGNVLIVDGKPLRESKKVTFSEFITLLGTRQIGLLAFLQGMDRDEFISFLNLLALEPEELQNRGGFSAQLPKHDIQHIVAKDIAYESKDKKGITLDWGDFSALLSAPEDLMAEIKDKPKSVAGLIMEMAGKKSSEAGEKDQLAYLAVNMLQKMADMLFEAYGRSQPDEYAQELAKVALAMDPSLHRLLIDTKSDRQEWARVVEVMISRIPDEDLVKLAVGKFKEAAKETREFAESSSYEEAIKMAEGFLRKVLTDSERKNRLLPILRKKLTEVGITEEERRRLLTKTSSKPNIFSLFETELSGKPPLSMDTLVTIKMALDAKADIEKLVRPFIRGIDEENPETRTYVSEKLRNWTKEIIALGRYDLIEAIIDELCGRLRKEDILDVYECLVITLRDIAIALLKKEKRSYSERIVTAFINYLSAVKDQPQGKMLTDALGKIGDKTALKQLVSLLGSTKLDKEAGRWIVKAGDEAIQPLLWALRIVEDKNTRLRITEVLSQLGEGVLPAINHELRDSRWYVRRNACTVLSKIPSIYPLEPLSILLHDPVPQVRSEAIAAMSNIGGEEAENLVLPMIMDKQVLVQHSAIEVLGRIGSEKSVETLISFIQTSKFRGKREILGKAALRALGEIGNEKAKEFLKEVVEKRSWKRLKYPEKMRKESIEMLTKLGGVDCRIVLLKATKDKSDVVKFAALAALRKLSRKSESTP